MAGENDNTTGPLLNKTGKKNNPCLPYTKIFSGIFATTIITIKLAGSIGFNIFSGNKFNAHRNSNLQFTYNILAALFPGIVILISRIQPVYEQVNKRLLPAPPSSERTAKTCSSLVTAVTLFGIFGGIFASLNSFLGIITLTEMKPDQDLQSLPWIGFLCNLISFYCFNLPDSIEQADSLNNRRQLAIPQNFNQRVQLLICLVGIAAYGFLAFFGTRHGLTKTEAIPQGAIEPLSYFSMACALIMISFTRIPAFLKFINHRPKLHFNQQTNWKKALIITLCFSGIFDVPSMGVNYFQSTVDTGAHIAPGYASLFFSLGLLFAFAGSTLHFAFAIFKPAAKLCEKSQQPANLRGTPYRSLTNV